MPIAKITPQVISAWLRLGTKYQLDRLRNHAITVLRARYPRTLKDYDAWYKKSTEGKTGHWNQKGGDIIALNLARKFGLRSLLPAACLACSQLRIDQLVADQGHSSPHHEDFTVLSTDDLRRCLNGRELLFDFYAQRLDLIYSSNSIPKKCEDVDYCQFSLGEAKESTSEEGFRDHLQLPLRRSCRQ